MKRLDKFFTKQEVAASCILFLQDCLEIPGDALFLEPSAGSGSFVRALRLVRCAPAILAFDLDPEDSDVNQANFYDVVPSGLVLPERNKVVIIGNPPFGRGARYGYKEALAFLHHAANFGDTIAFILPAAFSGRHQQERVRPDLRLLSELVLPNDAFETQVNIKCVFQIWIRSSIEREVSGRPRAGRNVFVPQDQARSAIVRVGSNAGKVRAAAGSLSRESHFFLGLELPHLDGTFLLKPDPLRRHPYVTREEVLLSMENLGLLSALGQAP